ncbi:ABC transporter permease [Streptomyces sp. HSG2]|uniref:ABC transporter permease n=1 Tax=Streptomyces sp. HSG2 TaxID=2797167 RepID=UPI0019053276|nr:ABC transporter permease [Streptomyces sp. HSG2]
MAGPDTTADRTGHAHDLHAGLDALDTTPTHRTPLRTTLTRKVLPPLVALVLLLTAWQALVSLRVVDDPSRLPAPSAVADALTRSWLEGRLLDYIWTSLSRGLLGFALALLIATPLGLLLAHVPLLRSALQPLLTGLQSLPSVAWVPPAVIWLGLNDRMMFAVILLGAVPSIANGLVSGIDHVPPQLHRAGRTLGAGRLQTIRHVTLPAALPGYIAGLKQGWAFSWRSLMAAEIIASFPDLGTGLGQLLENGRTAGDMAMVFEAILLILAVGITIDLLVFGPLERHVLRTRGLHTGN